MPGSPCPQTAMLAALSRVQGSARAVAASVTEARGRMHLLRATTWRRHGGCSLAAAAACTFISCHSDDPDDTLQAYAQLALLACDRRGVRRLSPPQTKRAQSTTRPIKHKR